MKQGSGKLSRTLPGVYTSLSASLFILSNFLSNACKFTLSGGNLSISTRLILPDVPEGMDPLDIETAKIPRIEKPEIHPNGERDVEKLSHHTSSHSRSGDSFHNENGVADAFWDENDEKRVRKPLSTELLMEHNQQHATSALEYIVVRIEVTDTGFGIKPQDMAESKLFCELLSNQANCVLISP